MQMTRNSTGGRSCTPYFITGQLNPQARVRNTSRIKSRLEMRLIEGSFRKPCKVSHGGSVARHVHRGVIPTMRAMDSFSDRLAAQWRATDSLLCVGLDPDPSRFPAHLRDGEDAIYAFCRAIVDATGDLVCAFK